MAKLTNEQVRKVRIFKPNRPGKTYVANLSGKSLTVAWLGVFGKTLPPLPETPVPMLVPVRKNNPAFRKRKEMLSDYIDQAIVQQEDGYPLVAIGTYDEIMAAIEENKPGPPP